MKILIPLLLLQTGYVFTKSDTVCNSNNRCATQVCAALNNFWETPYCSCYGPGCGDPPHHDSQKKKNNVPQSEKIVAKNAVKWCQILECEPKIGSTLGANTEQKNTIVLLGDDIEVLKDVMTELKDIPGSLAVKFYLDCGDTNVNIGEIRTDYWSLLQCLGSNYCFSLKPSQRSPKIKVFPRSHYGAFSSDNNTNNFYKRANDENEENYCNERERNKFRKTVQANDNLIDLKNHDIVKSVDKDGDGTVDYFYADLQLKDVPEKNKDTLLVDLIPGLNDRKFQSYQQDVDLFRANINCRDDHRTNYEVAPGKYNFEVGSVKNVTLSPQTNANLPEMIYLPNILPYYNYAQFNNECNRPRSQTTNLIVNDNHDSNKNVTPIKHKTVDLMSNVFDNNINLLNRHNSQNMINSDGDSSSRHYKEGTNVKQLWNLVSDPNKYGFEVAGKKDHIHTDLQMNLVKNSDFKMPKSQIFEIGPLSTGYLSQIYETMPRNSNTQITSKNSYPTPYRFDAQVPVPESSIFTLRSSNFRMPPSQDQELTGHTLGSQTLLIQPPKPTLCNSNVQKTLQDPHSTDSQDLIYQSSECALPSFYFQNPFSHDSCPMAQKFKFSSQTLYDPSGITEPISQNSDISVPITDTNRFTEVFPTSVLQSPELTTVTQQPSLLTQQSPYLLGQNSEISNTNAEYFETLSPNFNDLGYGVSTTPLFETKIYAPKNMPAGIKINLSANQLISDNAVPLQKIANHPIVQTPNNNMMLKPKATIHSMAENSKSLLQDNQPMRQKVQPKLQIDPLVQSGQDMLQNFQQILENYQPMSLRSRSMLQSSQPMSQEVQYVNKDTPPVYGTIHNSKRNYHLASYNHFTFNEHRNPSITSSTDDSSATINSEVPKTVYFYEDNGLSSIDPEYNQNNIASTAIYEPKVIFNPIIDKIFTKQPSRETRYNSYKPNSDKNPNECPSNADFYSIFNKKINADIVMCPANPEPGLVCPINKNYDSSPLTSTTETVLDISDTCPVNHGPGFICPLIVEADYNNPNVYPCKSANAYFSPVKFIIPDEPNTANEKSGNISPWTESSDYISSLDVIPTKIGSPSVSSNVAFPNVDTATSRSRFISPLKTTDLQPYSPRFSLLSGLTIPQVCPINPKPDHVCPLNLNADHVNFSPNYDQRLSPNMDYSNKPNERKELNGSHKTSLPSDTRYTTPDLSTSDIFLAKRKPLFKPSALAEYTDGTNAKSYSDSTFANPSCHGSNFAESTLGPRNIKLGLVSPVNSVKPTSYFKDHSLGTYSISPTSNDQSTNVKIAPLKSIINPQTSNANIFQIWNQQFNLVNAEAFSLNPKQVTYNALDLYTGNLQPDTLSLTNTDVSSKEPAEILDYTTPVYDVRPMHPDTSFLSHHKRKSDLQSDSGNLDTDFFIANTYLTNPGQEYIYPLSLIGPNSYLKSNPKSIEPYLPLHREGSLDKIETGSLTSASRIVAELPSETMRKVPDFRTSDALPTNSDYAGPLTQIEPCNDLKTSLKIDTDFLTSDGYPTLKLNSNPMMLKAGGQTQLFPARPQFSCQTQFNTAVPETNDPAQSNFMRPKMVFDAQFPTPIPKLKNQSHKPAIPEGKGPIPFTSRMPQTRGPVQFSVAMPEFSSQTQFSTDVPEDNGHLPFISTILETKTQFSRSVQRLVEFSAAMPKFSSQTQFITETGRPSKISDAISQISKQEPFETDEPLPEVSSPIQFVLTMPKTHLPSTEVPTSVPYIGSITQSTTTIPDTNFLTQFTTLLPKASDSTQFTFAMPKTAPSIRVFKPEVSDQIQYITDMPGAYDPTTFSSIIPKTQFDNQFTASKLDSVTIESSTGMPDPNAQTRLYTLTPEVSSEMSTKPSALKHYTVLIPNTSENNVSTQFTPPASSVSTLPTVYSYPSMPASYSVKTPVSATIRSLQGLPNSKRVDTNQVTPLYSKFYSESLLPTSLLSRPHFSFLSNAQSSQSMPVYSTAESYPTSLSSSESDSSFPRPIITKKKYSNTLPVVMSSNVDVPNTPATNKLTLLSVLPSSSYYASKPLLFKNTKAMPSKNNKMESYGSISTLSQPSGRTYNPIESIIRQYGSYSTVTEPNRGPESHVSSLVTVSPNYETKSSSNSPHTVDNNSETKLSITAFANRPSLNKPTYNRCGQMPAPKTFASNVVNNQDVLTCPKPYAFTENTDNIEIPSYDQVTDPQSYLLATPIVYQLGDYASADDNLSQSNHNPINVVSTKVSLSDASSMPCQGAYNCLDEKVPVSISSRLESTFNPFSTILGSTFETLSIPTSIPRAYTPTSSHYKSSDHSFIPNSTPKKAYENSYNYNPCNFYMKPRTMTQNTAQNGFFNVNDIPVIEPEAGDLENILQDLPKKLKYELQNYINNKSDNFNYKSLDSQTFTADLGNICYGKYIANAGITYPTDNPNVFLKAWYSVNTVFKPTLTLETEQRRTLNFIPLVESRYIPNFESPKEIQDIAKQYIARYLSKPYVLEGVYSAVKPYAPINISNSNGISILWPTFCSCGCYKAGCGCQWK